MLLLRPVTSERCVRTEEQHRISNAWIHNLEFGLIPRADIHTHMYCCDWVADIVGRLNCGIGVTTLTLLTRFLCSVPLSFLCMHTEMKSDNKELRTELRAEI